MPIFDFVCPECHEEYELIVPLEEIGHKILICESCKPDHIVLIKKPCAAHFKINGFKCDGRSFK